MYIFSPSQAQSFTLHMIVEQTESYHTRVSSVKLDAPRKAGGGSTVGDGGICRRRWIRRDAAFLGADWTSRLGIRCGHTDGPSSKGQPPPPPSTCRVAIPHCPLLHSSPCAQCHWLSLTASGLACKRDSCACSPSFLHACPIP